MPLDPRDQRDQRSMPAEMSRAEIELFYSEFYARMVRDVRREVDWQRDHPGEMAGNILCGLALVVYTEVLGRVAIEQLERRYAKSNPHAFNVFVDRMGGGTYAVWRKKWEKRHAPLTLYDLLRNGLVHRYVPMKASTKFWFYFEEQQTFGLDEEPEFDLVLKIRPYYDDFCRAGEELFRELRERTSSAAEASR